MHRRDGKPLWVVDGQHSATALNRADLGVGAASGHYDETWLQALLHCHPEIFPIGQIESEFGDLIPLCRELPLASVGLLDNLFVTRDGQLVLVEAKLWRNPEARRKVVAQALDYAAAVFRMSYGELECAVLKAGQVNKEPAESLVKIAAGDSEGFDEAEFVDAMQRNLERGRAVIAVVGDGIREGVVQLADLVQSHAGHRFTFALVELAVYETPATGVRLMVPSVLAQTKLIERGVVRIEGTIPAGLRVTVEPASLSSKASTGRMGIAEDQFYELLGQREPGMPEILKTFLAKAEAFGVYTDLQGGMSLKHASPAEHPLNVGAITKGGIIDIGPSTWWGDKAAARTYNESLAKLIGGSVIEVKNGTDFVLRIKEDRMPRLSDLLPQHEQAWLDAMEQYIRECLTALPADKSLKALA
jgi:hypothetical protein